MWLFAQEYDFAEHFVLSGVGMPSHNSHTFAGIVILEEVFQVDVHIVVMYRPAQRFPYVFRLLSFFQIMLVNQSVSASVLGLFIPWVKPPVKFFCSVKFPSDRFEREFLCIVFQSLYFL